MKKRILFVAPNLHHGGAEAVLVKILNNIDLDLFDVKLVLVKKEGGHLSKLRKEINIIDLDSTGAFSTFLKLKRVIEIEKPNTVFSIIGHINLILSSLKMLFFKEITFIGRENVVYSEWFYNEVTFKKRILKLGYMFFLKKLDIVVVQSKYMENQVKKYFKVPEYKIKIMNNPIEINKINLLRHENDLGIKWNKEKTNLIAIGRIEDVKNYREMIDIIKIIPSNFHLNIFGDGSGRNNLEKYISEKKLESRVTIHGFVENPYKYLNNSLMLLLTSKRESFPNVVLEANACGVYVISYNMPGGIEEILDNEELGSLIPLGEKRSFVTKIEDIYNTGYDSIYIQNNSQKYSVENYMKDFYSLLK